MSTAPTSASVLDDAMKQFVKSQGSLTTSTVISAPFVVVFSWVICALFQANGLEELLFAGMVCAGFATVVGLQHRKRASAVVARRNHLVGTAVATWIAAGNPDERMRKFKARMAVKNGLDAFFEKLHPSFIQHVIALERKAAEQVRKRRAVNAAQHGSEKEDASDKPYFADEDFAPKNTMVSGNGLTIDDGLGVDIYGCGPGQTREDLYG